MLLFNGFYDSLCGTPVFKFQLYFAVMSITSLWIRSVFPLPAAPAKIRIKQISFHLQVCSQGNAHLV